MNTNNLYKLSASESISQIKSGTISVQSLTESLLQRIEEINPKVNVWVHLNKQKTLEAAKNFDKKIQAKVDINPLYGIPIGIKDTFNTMDFPTEMGSPIWKGFTSGNDARVVHDLRMANALIIGKTETAEFAVHALGNSKNPYDNQRNPGTSSSGSAVAVATCMVPLALGTQTAGSIIRPASYCGIYGFKPSFGLIPRTGMLKTTDSLDQIGYFARTVADLELLFDIIRVKGRNYPLSDTALSDPKRQQISDRKWKIRLVKSPTWHVSEKYAQRMITDFIETLSKDNDFQVEEWELSDVFNLAHSMHQTIYAKSLAYYFKNELTDRSLVSDIFYEFAAQAQKISMEQFNTALAYQSKIRNILDSSFLNFDIILSLSTSGHAPLRNEQEKDDPSLIWSMCGVPSINIPAFKTPSDLPMGLQIVSRRYNDKLLLNFTKLLRKKELIPDAPYPPLDLNS